MKLRSTRNVAAQGVNVCVYGAAGVGKTSLIKTMPAPVVLSAEGGLLSISDSEIPFIEVTSISVLKEAYAWLATSEEAKQFESIALDSISEIAEVLLVSEKRSAKDPRQAYGALSDQMAELIRAFRDIPKHVYFSAKMEKTPDESGRILYGPSMPGNKLGQALPYFFDEVLALRIEEGSRALMAQPDGLWTAKDRSGKLKQWEAPDLGEIIRKIGGKK